MIKKKLQLMSVKEYSSILKKELPSDIFQSNPSRLLVLLIHSIIVILSIYISVSSTFLFLKIIFSIIAGHSLGIIGFIGHETLHGSVVKKRKWQYIIGGYCVMQFGLHPKVWKVWHNNHHHKNTQDPFNDPDCFGHVMAHRKSKLLRFIEKILPGSGKFRSIFFLFYWFSIHTILINFVNSYSFLDPKTRIKGQIYLILTLSIWIGGTIFFGGLNGFFFAFFIPLAISNFLMMSYISTQHFLNPLTVTENDPLINSLTVRSPRWIEKLHLNTGYHSVHHIFPSLNPKNAPTVNTAIKETWPDRFREMDHIKALRQIYRTPRFYSKWDILQNPRTGKKAHTIYSDIDNHPII